MKVFMMKKSGVSMVELLVILAMTIILAILAVPSFINYIKTTRLKGLAQTAYYNMQYARSEAIRSNGNTYVSLTSGTSWCYGLGASAGCTCGTPTGCSLGTQKAESQDITLSVTGLGTSFSFEPLHGGASKSGSLTFTSSNSTLSVTINVSSMGSISICSPTISDFTTC